MIALRRRNEEFATAELEKIKENYLINEKKIKLFLLPKDLADSKNAIIEIRAGYMVDLKQAFLLQIYLKCMKKLVKKKNGLLK